MRVLLFLALVVTIWRVTRLMIKDTFPPIKAIRDWSVHTFGVLDRDGALTSGKGPRGLRGLAFTYAYIWTCPWCMSVWAGAAVVALADWRLDVPYPWLIVAAGSGLAGVMTWFDVEHDQRYEINQREIDRRG